MFQVDVMRYRRLKRNDVLGLFTAIEMEPDQFIAHRNHTFTAKFLKTRLAILNDANFEARLENRAEHGLAVFKRPTRLDRGKYVTFRFGFVAIERLGIQLHQESNGDNPVPMQIEGDLALASRMIGIVRDMKQLTQYASDLIESDSSREHALVALSELEKQINRMADGLHQMIKSAHPKV